MLTLLHITRNTDSKNLQEYDHTWYESSATDIPHKKLDWPALWPDGLTSTLTVPSKCSLVGGLRWGSREQAALELCNHWQDVHRHVVATLQGRAIQLSLHWGADVK